MSVRTDYLNLVVNVNGNAAKKEYSDLKAKQAQISAELREMKKGTEEYIKKSKELDEVTKKVNELRGQIDLSALSIKDLRKEISRMKAVRDELDPASDAFKQLDGRIKQAEGRMRDLAVGTDFTSKAMNFLKREILAFGAIAVAALGIDFIIGKIGNLIQRNAELSDSFANVAKTTGLTANQVKELSKEISNIDTRTSKKYLLELATIAGKLGKTSQEEILGFVNAMNQLNVALGEDLGNPEEVSKSLGKLIQTFQIESIYGTEQALLKTGSAINTLGASSTANEGYLVDFANRMGGIAPLANISMQEILGLGATLDQFGQTSEVSSTALSKIFVKMSEAPEMFAKFAKMDVTSFKNLIDQDFMSAFISVLEGVGDNADGMNALVESLGDLEIEGGRVTGVLGVLANNTQTLRDQIDLSNKSFAAGTSVTEEYAIKNENLAAKVEKLKKEFVALWQSDAINNFIGSLIEGFSKVITAIKEFSAWIQRNAFYIKALVAAYATYYTAVLATYTWSNRLMILQKAQTFIQAGLSLAVGVYSNALLLLTGKITMATIAQRAKNAVMLANPYAAVAAAVIGLGVAIGGLIKKHKELKEQFEKEVIEIKYKVKLDELKRDVIENTQKLKAELNGLSGDKLALAAEATKAATTILEDQLNSDQAQFDKILLDIQEKRKQIEEQDKKFLGGSRSKANQLENDLRLLNIERESFETLIEDKKKALEEFQTVNDAYQTKRMQEDTEQTTKAKELTEKQKEEAKKRLEAKIQEMKDLKNAIDEFDRDRLLSTLSNDQREIEAIGQKYQKWLVIAKQYSEEYNKLIALMNDEIAAKQNEQDKKAAEIRQKALKEIQDIVSAEQEKSKMSAMADRDKEAYEVERHYQSLIDKVKAAREKDIENAALYDALEKTLLELKLLGLAAITEKYRSEDEKKLAEHLRKKADLEREIANNPWVDQDPFQQERQRIADHYRELEEQAKEHYGKNAEDAQIYSDLMEQIAQQREAALTAVELDEMAARRDARVQAYQAIAGATGDFITMLTSEQQKMSKAQKAATLLQISMDTASAISSLMKMSEANPTNAVTFGGAAALQFASGIIRIMANVGMAMKTLMAPTASDKANKVKQKAKGGYADVRGEDDNRSYSARLLPGFEQGYLSNPALVLAGEKGEEYFVNNDMLQNKKVASVVEGIEALSRGRINTVDFSNLLEAIGKSGRGPSTSAAIAMGDSAPQDKPGTSSPSSSTSSGSNTGKPRGGGGGSGWRTDVSTEDVLVKMYDLLQKGIKAEAYIGDQTVIDFKKRQQYLDNIEREAN